MKTILYAENREMGLLSTLLKWNEVDPPSREEKLRNERICKIYQHNRNPFVDHPEYANLIWKQAYWRDAKKGKWGENWDNWRWRSGYWSDALGKEIKRLSFPKITNTRMSEYDWSLVSNIKVHWRGDNAGKEWF